MVKIDHFPVQPARKAPWEMIPRVNERVFDILESLILHKDKKREDLTEEQRVELEALKDVFGELSTVNHGLVTEISLACGVGKISYLEKVLLTVLLLSVQRNGRGMRLVLSFFSGDSGLVNEARNEIVGADFLSQQNQNFLLAMADKIVD